MTRDDIIRMAHEAGVDSWWDSGNDCREDLQAHLEHFSGLIAAAEREACAEIADEYDYQLVAGSCARDIRARGNQ